MKVRIEGVVVPTRPLHCATSLDPDLRFDYETRRPVRGKHGMPMIGSVTKGILPRGQDRPDIIPYFPANDIRGRLRRHAAELVMQHLASRGEAVLLDTFDGMNAGNFRGRPDNTPTTLTEMQEVRKHFFMGLFGGGPRTLPSKLITHDLDPIYTGTIELGTVPERYASYAFQGQSWEMTDIFGCIRRDDTSNFTNLSMMEYIKDAFTAINNRQDELTVARNKRRQQKKDAEASDNLAEPVAVLKKDDLANMFAFQAIRAGLPLYLEIAFSAEPSEAQVGLLLEALLSIFKENALGGLISKGAGRFDAHAQLFVDGRNLGPVIVNNRDTVDEQYESAFILTDLAEPYVDAKDEAFSRTSAADLDRFFVYGNPVKPLDPAATEAA